ncbi:MAG: ribulose-phosphate 3-epimerase [Candidatus Omnitrophota bacterium]
MKKTIKVAASVLAVDFSNLEKEIKSVESAGVDLLHIDVMDGHFVNNITIGPCVVESIRKVTKLPLLSHLMISNPQKYALNFAEAGSDLVTMHIETISVSDFIRVAKKLKERRVKVGVALNPATPLLKIKALADVVDLILVMSVNPGFGGQKFMPEVLPKIVNLRKIFKKDIEVDGGINARNAALVIAAGANILAAGSYIFKSQDRYLAIRSLRNAK